MNLLKNIIPKELRDEIHYTSKIRLLVVCFVSFLHMLVAGDERVRTELIGKYLPVLKVAFNIYLFRKRAVYIGDSLFLSVRPEVVKRCLCTFHTFSFCADKKKKY